MLKAKWNRSNAEPLCHSYLSWNNILNLVRKMRVSFSLASQPKNAAFLRIAFCPLYIFMQTSFVNVSWLNVVYTYLIELTVISPLHQATDIVNDDAAPFGFQQPLRLELPENSGHILFGNSGHICQVSP